MEVSKVGMTVICYKGHRNSNNDDDDDDNDYYFFTRGKPLVAQKLQKKTTKLVWK